MPRRARRLGTNRSPPNRRARFRSGGAASLFQVRKPRTHTGARSQWSRTREDNDRSVYVIEERREIAREAGQERFDRIAFALRALEILKPRSMTVAVFHGRFGLKIERGRDWGGGPDATWAMVSIPADATRENIILALTELSGLPATPWLLDTLLSHRALDGSATLPLPA
jgi:hypothetical protein